MIKTRIIFPNGENLITEMVGPPAVNEPLMTPTDDFIVSGWSIRPEHEADEDGCWMTVTMVAKP